MVALAFAAFLVLAIHSILRHRPWVLLVAWLVSPPLKQLLEREVPGLATLDLVLLLWMLTVAAMGYEVITRPRPWTGYPSALLVIHLGLASLMCLSLLWTPAPQYGAYKGLRFLLLNTTLLVAPVLFLRTLPEVERFALWVTVLTTAIYAKIAIFPSYELTGGGVKYLRAGFAYGAESAAAGISVAAAFCSYLLVTRRDWRVRAACVVALLFIIAGSLMSGTRTLLATIALSPVLMAVLASGSRARMRAAVGGVIAGASLLYVPMLLPRGTLRGVLFTVQDSSTGERITHWQTAWAAAGEHPLFGLGAGGYAVYSNGRDLRWFPHNIFLEALAEMGVPGFVLLLALVLVFCVFVVRVMARSQGLPSTHQNRFRMVVVASATMFLQTLVTDDLADNRWLHLLMGVVCAAGMALLAERRNGHADAERPRERLHPLGAAQRPGHATS